MSYQQIKVKIDLLKIYVAVGKELLVFLVESLEKIEIYDCNDWYDSDSDSGGGGNVFFVVFFVGLLVVFVYEGYSGLIGMGEEVYFVVMIMGVLVVVFFFGSLFKGGKK